jgi:adenylate cyclase
MMAEGARISRKLTTILSADIAGYSGLMEADEVGTLDELKTTRSLLTALIERHQGRVVNTAGDGLLAEFGSVVEAVLCAIEVQRELGARPAAKAGQLRYRIGINLGDVMLDDGDLFGEGVNVAARLQALAEPGGILISGNVHDLVRGKLDVAYDYLGPQQVKNILTPVPAYRIALDGGAGRKERHRGAAEAAAESTQADLPEDEPPKAGPPQPDPSGAGANAAGIGGFGNLRQSVLRSPPLLAALALGALSLLPKLDWMAWPGLGLAYAGGVGAIARRLRGRARAATQLGLVILLLLGINILSHSTEWWFIYPGAVLAVIAFVLYPQCLGELRAWLERR